MLKPTSSFMLPTHAVEPVRPTIVHQLAIGAEPGDRFVREAKTYPTYPIERALALAGEPFPSNRRRFLVQNRPDGVRQLVDRDAAIVRPALLHAGGVRLPRETVPGQSIRLALIGDSGEGDGEQMQVADSLARYAKDQALHFTVHVGDMFYPHGVKDVSDPAFANRFTEPYDRLGRVYAALGNHEYGSWQSPGNPQAVLDFAESGRSKALQLPARYYEFSYGNDAEQGTGVDFFVLDTSVLAVDQRQLDWLDQALDHSTAQWKIVIGHHPIYSNAWHSDSPVLKKVLLPLLAGRVQLYASGHEHNQQILSDEHGLLQLISGAGGHAQYTVKPDGRSIHASVEPGYATLELSREKLTIDIVNAASGQSIGQYQRSHGGHGRS